MKNHFKHLPKLFLLFSFGCSDFLTLSPETERNVLNSYHTPSDFNNALMGGYATLRTTGIYGNSLIWMGEISTDNSDYGVTRASQNVDNFQFIDKNYTSLNSIIYNAWRDHYVGLRRVNAIINRIQAVEMGEAVKNQYTGEAKFLRALYYFNLVRLFGEVPLVTSEITDPEGGTNLPRASKDEIYKLIIADLTDAEENLPEVYTSSQSGRATREAARGILGKVYLTRKEWEKAAQKLKEIIDSGSYRLLANYSEVFSYTTPVNDEILFNVQYKSGNTGQGSNFGRAFAPSGVGISVLGPNAGTGGGLNRPTDDLVNAYEEGDLRKPFTLQTSYIDNAGRRVEGNYVSKYIQFGALAGDSDVDFPVLRYADVLLMYGETLNELGETQHALGYINQIRLRAGLKELSDLNQNTYRLAMEKERRLELAFENHRWFDLIRTNRYLEVMRSKGSTVRDHHILYLIPQLELDLNPSLIQNPGYNEE